MRLPKILCIIGESGTGKSEAAEYIERKYNIPMIRSYTDRPQRPKNDDGHTFLTKEEFDKLKYEDMIAFNDRFANYRYCCLKQDVKPLNSYVIDEAGLIMLLRDHGHNYDIKSLRIHRKLSLRKEKVDPKRLARDKGNFIMPFTDFDYHVSNNGNLMTFYRKLDKIVELFFGEII